MVVVFVIGMIFMKKSLVVLTFPFFLAAIGCGSSSDSPTTLVGTGSTAEASAETGGDRAAPIELLNVSYDPTREQIGSAHV